MNLSTECLEVSQVDSLLQGNLTPEEYASAQEHMEGCEQCRRRVEETIGPEQWWCDVQSVLLNSRSSLFTKSQATAEDAEPNDTPTKLLDLLGPTDDPNMLGRIGPYEIIGLLGQGGMGAVFKGFDRSLNRFVAIKMLLPHLAASGAARKRFAREGQAVAAVVDDHVMAIHCVDEWQGVPYLVMTYSRGISLQKRLNDNGPLEVREILRIGMQAAKGLAAAHAQGIVHRDIKPANIFLDQSVERVQLMDFGLARAVDDASLTRSGTLAGTPQYMSPEQARAETVDHRSDLFSLGSVLYAMCTGHAPFRAESSYSVLRLITDKEPRPIREINSDIPEWLCVIISKLMAKQASERFDSAQEVAELLGDCLAHLQQPSLSALPRFVAALAPKRSRRPPFGKIIAAAAFSFSVIFAGVLIVLEMNKGTLTIESEADDVPIRIMQGEKVVEKLTISKDDKSIRIAAGKYLIVVENAMDGIVVKEGGNIELKRGETTVVKVAYAIDEQKSAVVQSNVNKESEAVASSGVRAWQQGEPYIAPQYTTFFPESKEGALALGVLWNASDKDSRSDEEILKTVRTGFRNTGEHRMPILRWIGNKYIWNKSDQNPDAIEIMYHAADFSGEDANPSGARHAAVYFGLSVTEPKTPAMLRTLAELAMRVDDPNDLDRIAWGCKGQKAELLEYLKPFEASDDEAIRSKASVCHKIFIGELKAFVWAAEQARQRAEKTYSSQLPLFKETLTSGNSEERLKALQTILRHRIALIMDDTFVAAFAKSAEDKDPMVRKQVTIIAGSKWVWESQAQNPDAIQLMLRLSKDDVREVRYNAVYYGLSTVLNKSDDVIRRLLEMAFEDREWNLFSRIEWGLRGDRDRVRTLLMKYLNGDNEAFAKSAREVFKQLTGSELQNGDPASETRVPVQTESTRVHQLLGHWKIVKLAHMPADQFIGSSVVIDEHHFKMHVPSQKGPHPHWRYTLATEGEMDLHGMDDAKGEAISRAKYLLEGKTLYLALNGRKGDYPRPESATGEVPQAGVQYIVLEIDELANSTGTAMPPDSGDEKHDDKPQVPAQPLGKTLQQLQGKWQLSRQIDPSGDESATPHQSVWEFKGDRIIVRDGGPGGTMLIEVDDTQSPVHVKLTNEIDDVSGLGLMSVEGDKAIFFMTGKLQKAPEPQSRPEKLQWVSGVYCMELTRMKPGETIVPLQPKMNPLPMTESVSNFAATPTPIIADQSKAPAVNHGNARSVVEAYVAAALAGDIAKTATLAKNSPADPKRIKKLPEFLNVQRLKIETVYVNDPAKPTRALATSVAVKLDEDHKQPDGRRDGFMVFTLELTDDKWFVIDIDFESESGAEKELKRFLEANPNSIGLPPLKTN